MSEEHLHHSDDDLIEIMAAYRRQKMIEHLVGPAVATVFHVVLFFALTVLVVFETAEKDDSEIVVEQIEQEIVELEEDIPEPEKEEEEVDEVPEDSTSAAIDLASDVPDQGIDEEDSEDNLDLPSLDIEDFKSPLKSSYVARSRKGMGDSVRKFGGDSSTILAVDKALKWLSSKQNPDGSWGNLGERSQGNSGTMKALGSRPALTGLAILTFLAQGETHLSAKYGKTLRNGLTWLSEQMNTHRYLPGGSGHGYDHLIATYALAEAAGITQITDVQEAMEIGITQIIKRQNSDGGYGYAGGHPHNWTKNNKTDTSLSAWAFQALKAATIAGSLNPNLDSAKEKLIKALGKNYVSRKNKKGDKIVGYGYKEGRADTIESDTAFALLCMQLQGKSKEKQARDAYDDFKDYMPNTLTWDPVEVVKGFKMSMPLYIWYYSTQIFFNEQGQAWKKWNSKFKKLYVANQKNDGHWESPSAKEYNHKYLDGSETDLLNGQIYSTAFCAITLTVYYRNLPTLKKVTSQSKKDTEKVESEIDELDIF